MYCFFLFLFFQILCRDSFLVLQCGWRMCIERLCVFIPFVIPMIISTLKQSFAQLLHPLLQDHLTVEQIVIMMEYPPQAEYGDLAFPCFTLSKVLRKAPAMIAQELKDHCDQALQM